MQCPEPCREWKCQELTGPTGRAAPHRHSHPFKYFLFHLMPLVRCVGHSHRVTQRCLKCLLQFAEGKMLPLTGNTGDTECSWCVCLCTLFEREGGTDFILVSNMRSPIVTGIAEFSSTPIMGYLNTPVWRKPFPSWNCEGVVFAPALKENETQQCSGWWRFCYLINSSFYGGGGSGLACHFLLPCVAGGQAGRGPLVPGTSLWATFPLAVSM